MTPMTELSKSAKHAVTSRIFLWVFLSAMGVWTILATLYVVIDDGWGAICVAGIGSVIVNTAAAAVGVIYTLIKSLSSKRFHGRELAAAILAPAASAAIIFGAFAAQHLP